MGNSGEKDFLSLILECLEDEEPLIRIHALWALWKIEGVHSREILVKYQQTETDEVVNDEIDDILSSM